MRKSALAGLIVATVVSTWFYLTLNRIFPATTPEFGTILAAVNAVVFAGLFGIVYLGIADLQARDVPGTADGLAEQAITKLFRWDRTIRAMLLMAVIHLPFLMIALLLVYAGRPFSDAQLLIIPGAWIAAFSGGFVLGSEEPEAPYWTIEIAQVVLNLGCFAFLVVMSIIGWSDVALLGAAKIFFGRIVTYSVLCPLGAWVGARRRSIGELQRA